jgi:outer membrane protein assembly factor BamA
MTNDGRIKKNVSVFSAFVWILFLILVTSAQGLAQDKKDNTGTNPVNFTYDFRLITEMAELYNDGGSLLKHTAEFRWPLGREVANLRGDEEGSLFYDMGKMFSLRFRANLEDDSYENI